MLAKSQDDDRYAMCAVLQLAEVCKAGPSHVVITGGEPCEYDLTALTDALLKSGLTVQIETSGTAPIRVADDTWITLSPKLEMPGGKEFIRSHLWKASEIKMPVGKPADVLKLQKLMMCNRFPQNPIVWLQPLSTSPKATKICIEAASHTGARVSIQTHRYIGVR